MPSSLPAYGPTEGPLGFPMLDRQARALDALLKAMPHDDAYRYRKAVIERGPTELSSGERSDSKHRRSSGSVLEGRMLKCQSS